MKVFITFLMSAAFIFAQQRMSPEKMQQLRQQFQDLNLMIKGVVTDKSTGTAIEYANISVYSQKEDKIVTGTITDVDGKFLIEKMRPGIFYVVVDFIGYQSKRFNDIKLLPTSQEHDLGKVELEISTTTSDEEVLVTAERLKIENRIDKKVINVEQSIVSAGGNATDILAQVPSVTVDNNGEVALRGNSNVNVLIDGKPSNSTDGNFLESLPASSIERIEVVTNPSAKYDPEGTAGIINIILKKKSIQGYNLSTSAFLGNQEQRNFSLNGNYRDGSFNFFANVSFGSGKSENESFLNRQKNSYSLVQNSSGTFERKHQSYNLGFDYYIDDFRTLTLSGRGRAFGGESYSKTISKDTVELNYLSDGENDMDNKSYSITFLNQFDKNGHEILVDISKGNFDFDRLNKRRTTSNSPQFFPDFTSHYIAKNDFGQVKIDYTWPISKQSKLEAGFDYSNRDIQTDNINNQVLINKFGLDNNSFAAYTTYEDKWDKIGVQIGLRAENFTNNIKSGLSLDSLFKNEYESIFPSIHTAYYFSEKETVKLSYSRRVDRPDNRRMNPFEDRSNPNLIRKGNPYLKPQYIDSYEVGYERYWDKVNGTASLFFKRVNNLVSEVRLTANNEEIETSDNIGYQDNYGFDSYLSWQIAPKWNTTLNYVYNAREFYSDKVSLGQKNGSDWFVRWNLDFIAFDKLSVQFSTQYNSERVDAQRIMDPMYWSDIAFKMDFYEKSLSATLRISDIFDNREFTSRVNNNSYQESSSGRFFTRMISFGLTYNIMQLKMNDRKTRSRGADDGGDF